MPLPSNPFPASSSHASPHQLFSIVYSFSGIASSDTVHSQHQLISCFCRVQIEKPLLYSLPPSHTRYLYRILASLSISLDHCNFSDFAQIFTQSFSITAFTMFPKKKTMPREDMEFRHMALRKTAYSCFTLSNLILLLVAIPQLPTPVQSYVHKIVQPIDRANTYFQVVGETSHSLEFANVQINVELNPTIEQMGYLRADIIAYRERMKFSSTSSQWQDLELNLASIDRLLLRLTKIDFLRQNLPETEAETDARAKRFVFTLIALSILAASAAVVSYGIYSKVEIDKMGSNINTISAAETQDIRNVKLLGDSNQELIRLVKATSVAADSYYSEMEISGIHRAAIAVGTRRVDVIEGAYEAGVNNRLHLGVLQDVDIAKTFAGVQHYARTLGLVPIMKFFSDWTTLDTSLKQTVNGFTIFIHVPLMALGSEMTIYRHVHIPLPLPDSDLSLHIDSPYQYIAVGKDAALFRALSEHDLAECKQQNKFFTCPRGNLVRRAPHKHTITNHPHPEICLWALFTRDAKIAKSTCDHHVSLPDAAVFQVSPNKFILTSPANQSVFITCRNDTSRNPAEYNLARMTVLNLYSGCSVSTPAHHLNVSLFQTLLPELTALANSSRIPLNTALAAVQTIANQKTHESFLGQLIFHMPASMSGLLALISIFLHVLGCYLKFRNSQCARERHRDNYSPPPPTPSAPPCTNPHFQMSPASAFNQLTR